MQTPRFFIDAQLSLGILRIENQNILQHTKALRLKIQDKLSLFNGVNNQEFHATLLKVDKNYIDIDIVHIINLNRELKKNLHLVQALIVPSKIEMIAEKSTELGIKSMYLFPSIYSNNNFKNENVNKRLSRLNSIIISACEQCGRNTIPSISNFDKWELAIKFISSLPITALKIILLPSAKNTLFEINSLIQNPKYTDIYYIVGCEGGFSEQEQQILINLNCYSIKLTSTVLRAETASIALLSYLSFSLV